MSIQKQNQQDTFVADARAVFTKSDEVFSRVSGVAARRGMRIADVRGYMRKAAVKTAAGYEALAEAIVAEIDWSKRASKT